MAPPGVRRARFGGRVGACEGVRGGARVRRWTRPGATPPAPRGKGSPAKKQAPGTTTSTARAQQGEDQALTVDNFLDEDVDVEDEDVLTMFGLTNSMQKALFQLKFVWGQNTLAFAVDQVLGKGATSPLTEYYFWPQDDAWENLKSVLESKDWIPAPDKISLLNRVTEVINYWNPQENSPQNSAEQAQQNFPDCKFVGRFY
mmetsp:Transcript_7458/g.19161  ORF Transcript_7458/g.19161 Transcript_7458/m.19161 type:complete len:201 (+) Transcript_7458:39-641(+)